jgi:putative endonuclease
MYKNQEIGKIGEDVATRYLTQKDYQIVQKNFFCRQGEIDIIAKQREYIVFVEVKTRSNIEFGNPAEAVDAKKRLHMYKAAKYYLHIKKMENAFVRFDVIEIFVDRNRVNLNHIKQIM